MVRVAQKLKNASVSINCCLYSFITAPKKPCEGLGIKLPFLIIVVKNVDKPFSIEAQILDDKSQLRRFRISNYQSKTRVSNFSMNMPMVLKPGWNQIVLNLAEVTHNAYNSNYLETVRLTVNANCRLKNVYFSDRLYSEDEKPKEFRFQIVSKNQNCQHVNSDILSNVQVSQSLPAASSQSNCNNVDEEELIRMMRENVHVQSENQQRPPSPATGGTQPSNECWD